jgi:hypothetical protein
MDWELGENGELGEMAETSSMKYIDTHETFSSRLIVASLGLLSMSNPRVRLHGCRVG